MDIALPLYFSQRAYQTMSNRARTAVTRRRRAPARGDSVTAGGPLSFHRTLATARLAASITQAELAARMGTTQSAIARLESGDVIPTVETLCRIADVLGVRFEFAPRTGLVLRRAIPRRLTLADLRRRRDELLQIAATHGARHVHVFGSVARGHARPDSDIDFLVEFDPGRTVLDLSGLILDLEEALGRKVHVVEAQERSDLAERIRQEAVPL